jgi:hypothetical protein
LDKAGESHPRFRVEVGFWTKGTVEAFLVTIREMQRPVEVIEVDIPDDSTLTEELEEITRSQTAGVGGSGEEDPIQHGPDFDLTSEPLTSPDFYRPLELDLLPDGGYPGRERRGNGRGPA